MIVLHGYWRSTAAYRVRIALNFKQLEYQQESIHLVKDGGQQNSEAYRNLNPQGLVPCLQDGDFTISQSMAILEYLEEQYPQNPLLPSNLQTRAIARQLCQLIACDIHPLNNLRVLQYLSNELNVTNDEKTSWYHHWIRQGFDAFVTMRQQKQIQGPFSLGEELSLVDGCLIPQIYNAERFAFPMEAYPDLQAINNHCLGLQAFNDAAPEKQPDAVV